MWYSLVVFVLVDYLVYIKDTTTLEVSSCLRYMNGWIGSFTHFSIVFQSHQDNGRVNMKGSME